MLLKNCFQPIAKHITFESGHGLYGHTMGKSLILYSPTSNPTIYLGSGYKGLDFCRDNGRFNG